MRISLSNLRYLLSAAMLLASAVSLAQTQQAPGAPAQSNADTGSPLDAAARGAKTQKAHAKKVFTDEDMEVTAGPLPRLKMDGAENADDVFRQALSLGERCEHAPQMFPVFDGERAGTGYQIFEPCRSRSDPLMQIHRCPTNTFEALLFG